MKILNINEMKLVLSHHSPPVDSPTKFLVAPHQNKFPKTVNKNFQVIAQGKYHF